MTNKFRANTLPYILSVIGGLVLFDVISRVSNQPYFPKMSDVFVRMYELLTDVDVLSDFNRSLQNLFIGFSLSVIFGILFGVLCGRYATVERTLRPYINLMLTSPSILFVPIYFAVFGISRWAIIVLIIDYSVFFLIVSVQTAIQSVSKETVEMSAVFGATEKQTLRLIYLPSALPMIFTALRVTVGRAVKGMINGELFIAVIGIGARSQSFARQLDMVGVFALAFIVVGVALILGGVLNTFDKRVNSWATDASARA
jgi:ABC-type nitrate/sulfonate/bicarbonate transport system permease component